MVRWLGSGSGWKHGSPAAMPSNQDASRRRGVWSQEGIVNTKMCSCYYCVTGIFAAGDKRLPGSRGSSEEKSVPAAWTGETKRIFKLGGGEHEMSQGSSAPEWAAIDRGRGKLWQASSSGCVAGAWLAVRLEPPPHDFPGSAHVTSAPASSASHHAGRFVAAPPVPDLPGSPLANCFASAPFLARPLRYFFA